MGSVGEAVDGLQKRVLRVAVLECDEPVGRTKEKYGGYGNLFKELLLKGAEEVKAKDGKRGQVPELEVLKYDVVHHEVYPALEGVDAVLLSGSKFNSFDNDPWILKLVEFTKKVLAQDRVRLIGVCFGHQIIGRALDVEVGRSDKGWEVAVCGVELTDKGKELFGVEELAIHQMHRDIVYTYPKGIEHLGSSPRCEVQGMYRGKTAAPGQARLITVQGHPEFSGDIEEELIQKRYGMGIFDEAMYKDAMSRVRNHHDGVRISAAFIRFLTEE
ncbi:class I glutamine amidotransferase-like protein [Polychaeton citri CBS 116435]|uniref:Class I glutamine amidotransferase-like protein n=1 Tax=Polychaeton citri CBS 116435 TaxID=1314669 RepID=A0A9P4UNG1_9PEZI|nr:class I glutamine amidotransferase-like protein [Polychaeton citri CBS 116435]